jgi:ABC-2 type transport system permease protein
MGRCGPEMVGTVPAKKWLASYLLLMQWQLGRLKLVLPLVTIVQLFTGMGTVVGLGFLLPRIDASSALFLTTGAPTLTLLALGLALVPQVTAHSKAEGSFLYFWSLPVPRLAVLAADTTIWSLVTIPGVVLALGFGSWYYGFRLSVSPLVVPVFLLISLTATSVGYAIAHLVPRAEVVGVITNVIIFVVFLFSPINYPSERLPDWLAQAHRFLPVQPAAELVRETLTSGSPEEMARRFAVLTLWCAGALAATYAAATRRR